MFCDFFRLINAVLFAKPKRLITQISSFFIILQLVNIFINGRDKEIHFGSNSFNFFDGPGQWPVELNCKHKNKSENGFRKA